MPKSDIHPTWYPEAKVICNGEVVMTTGSTQPEIHVDVLSGNGQERSNRKKPRKQSEICFRGSESLG